MKQVRDWESDADREIEDDGLPILHRKVAGIDVGSKIHFVCAPTVDGSRREVKQFGATTPELEKLARWLQQRNVESVAMESTGVYWIPLHEVLERYGFKVLLVCTRELAQVPGPGCRKSTAEIAEQLSGHWREDHLFSLEQSLKMHDAIAERIQAYENEILRQLAEMQRGDCQGHQAPKLKNENKAKMIRQRGEEPMRQAWYRMSGDSH